MSARFYVSIKFLWKNLKIKEEMKINVAKLQHFSIVLAKRALFESVW